MISNRLLGITLLSVVVAVASCTDVGPRVHPFPCPEIEPDAAVEVTGLYRYASGIFDLSGTITFEQSASGVAVTDTTYDTGKDRALIGPGRLQGNRLDLVLIPRNGDTDYTANVSLVFTPGVPRFCLLEFSDTNGDKSGLASYIGERQQP